MSHENRSSLHPRIVIPAVLEAVQRGHTCTSRNPYTQIIVQYMLDPTSRYRFRSSPSTVRWISLLHLDCDTRTYTNPTKHPDHSYLTKKDSSLVHAKQVLPSPTVSQVPQSGLLTRTKTGPQFAPKSSFLHLGLHTRTCTSPPSTQSHRSHIWTPHSRTYTGSPCTHEGPFPGSLDSTLARIQVAHDAPNRSSFPHLDSTTRTWNFRSSLHPWIIVWPTGSRTSTLARYTGPPCTQIITPTFGLLTLAQIHKSSLLSDHHCCYIWTKLTRMYTGPLCTQIIHRHI